MNPSTDTGPISSAPADCANGTDLTGRTLGDYHILRLLGQGGMGSVYLAQQLSLKRRVALKILRADLAANALSLQRFKAEAEAVAKVTHPHIVQVYASGDIEGFSYIALEYVEGRNLKEFVSKKGPPETLLAVSFMRQIASALQRASEAGIIHRDIKPENILLTRKGEVKVADFGLSRCLDADRPALNLTQSGVTMGTPLYMSPEQAEGKLLDARTDIYSLGVTSYFMLSGQPPFDGATAFEVAMKHSRDEPPPLAGLRPDLPPALCAIVHKMMAKDPTDRYQTGRELLRDLLLLRDGLGGQTGGLSLEGLSVNLAAPPPASSPELTKAPAAATTAVTRRRLAALSILFVLTVATALAVGMVAGWLRRLAADATPPAPPAANTDAVETDDALLLVNDEEALRKMVDKYLHPASAGRNVSVGLGLCVDLGMLYLEQHRLDDAEKLFDRLSGMRDVIQYQALGRLGGAVVLALRDKAPESNQAFREAITTDPQLLETARKMKDKQPIDPDFHKMWQNPQFRFWLAQAISYNARNGIADKDMPPAVRKWREPAS